MAPNVRCLGLVICILATRYVAAQDLLGKMIPTDVLFTGAKNDAVHGHLQRMLQMDIEREEHENLGNCSPAALSEEKKCLTQSNSNSKPLSTSLLSSFKAGASVANCKGPGCLVAPMPVEKSSTDSKSSRARRHAPAQKAMPYGPMTQEAFERMVQRKRTALREELQMKGALTAELDAFLKKPDSQVKDGFGIPLPAGPSEPKPQGDFEMHFQPQAPSPDPAMGTTIATKSTSASSISSKLRNDFEMHFEPQAPAMDPSTLRSELEAFIAASPALQEATHHHSRSRSDSSSMTRPSLTASVDTTSPRDTISITDTTLEPAIKEQPKKEQSKSESKLEPAKEELAKSDSMPAHEQQLEKLAADKPVIRDAGSPTNGPARPPMTEQEAARLASQQAANAAAREAALARKRQMVEEELTAGKKAKRGSAASSKVAASSSLGSFQASLPQKRRSTSGSNLITSANVKRTTAADRAARRASSWGIMAYVSVAIFAAVSAVCLFVAAAVVEDALLARSSSVKNGVAVATAALPGHWLALTHSLWRRFRRAFAAARKQLTGHGSDLPMSANEGSSPIARAVAAASAFMHVFWTHRSHQHLCGAVAAAIDASRRASTGGVSSAAMIPDRVSAGGSAAASAYSSPFAAPQYQQSHGAAVTAVAASASYVIEADGSAATTATMELNLRRRH